MDGVNEELLYILDKKTGKRRAATDSEIAAKLPKLTPQDRVPIPKLEQFTSSLPSTGKRVRSHAKRIQNVVERGSHAAKLFLKYADKFKVSFSIEDLTPLVPLESVQEDLSAMQEEDYPYQAWNKQVDGRTVSDLQDLQAEQARIFNDGLSENQLKRYHEVVQTFAAHKQPHIKYKNRRHLMTSDNPRVMRYEVDDDAEDDEHLSPARERCGTYHLVHAWTQVGNLKKGLFASDALTGSGTSLAATGIYYKETQDIFLYISAMFHEIYPETYSKYKEAFEAGAWMQEDPGVFLGRVIVYKLQVHPHLDRGDDGPSVSFPCGYYDGGCMMIPQLKAKFLYCPGSICMFEAYRIYHAVSRWAPMVMEEQDVLTPGRISTVLFSPKNSVEMLKGKPPGWGKRTDFGRWQALV
ncbi:hypothetical protein C0991_007448 [Blastosporella zonata]|nr:hypothetical protein C0991_007448 [Blastosporella zonata]